MRKFYILLFGIVLLVGFLSCDTTPHSKHVYEVIKDAVTDVDGNHYDAVRIGDQVWMKQNLRTTRYADGTEIPLSNMSSDDPDFYFEEQKPFRWAPKNVGMNVQKFGWLYNWRATMRDTIGSDLNPSGVQGVCPDGWHVPSDAEWTQLTDYVSSDRKMRCWPSADFSIAKALSAQTDWNPAYDKCDVGHDLSQNNATGFSALPAGTSRFNFDYTPMGEWGIFWTSSYGYNKKSYCRAFASGNDNVFRDTHPVEDGISVRCVKD